MKHRLSFILTLISLLPTLVLAQGLLSNWYEWFNIPAEWTTPPNLIYYVFIPFLGTFAIIWGILTATRAPIFRNQRVNILISFVFTIALFYSSILPAIVLYLFTLGGFFGVLAFFVLFFVLTFLFGRRKVGAEYIKSLKTYEKAADKRRKEIDKIIDTDKRMEKLIVDEKKLKNEIESWKLALRTVEAWDPRDPGVMSDIKMAGFSSKDALLRHTRDNIARREKLLRENLKEQDKILKQKKRMREL